MIGSISIMLAAINKPKSVQYRPGNMLSIIGSVREFSTVTSVLANIYSLEPIIKAYTAVTETAGRLIGTIILDRHCILLQPSINPISTNSDGKASKVFFNIQMENGSENAR